MGKIMNIKVVPNAKKKEVIQAVDYLKIKVTAPPVEGKANKVLIDVLAEHFNVKKSAIKIIKGEKSRDKVVMIEGI